mgnify:CR=1 FL=1
MRMTPFATIKMLGGIMLAVVITACQPQGIDEGPDIAPSPSAYQDLMLRSDADASALAANEAKCDALGGTWRRDGMLGAYHCFEVYSDGGKICTDSDQCEGTCRVEGDDTATARCTPDSSPFGCYSRMEDGEPTGFLCVD